MTTKKLVQLDDETWGWTEIDLIKLSRVAQNFMNWLENLKPEDDRFGYLKEDLPLVEAALKGTMSLPYKGTEPHNWEIREGLIPREYLAISSPFYNTIRGAHLTPPEIIERDGKRYAWLEFEDL